MKLCTLTKISKPPFSVSLISIYLCFLPTFSLAQEPKIHALRSAYLYYFSNLIEWPANTNFIGDKLNLCATIDDEADRFQLSTIDKQVVGKRILKIVFIEKDDNIETNKIPICHILYVGQNFTEWLYQNANFIAPETLLVTEGKISNQGDIHLYTMENKLKFDIDNKKLVAKSFKVSSQLLRLSRKLN